MLMANNFITPNTWIISDTHFFHHRIAKYADRPEDHNWIMLRNWMSTVKANDNILHLGDVFLTKRRIIRRIAPFLTGNKYLVKGNHDSRKKMRKLAGFTVLNLSTYACKTNGLMYSYYPATIGEINIMFSHKPLPLDDLPEIINIHGHLHHNPVPDFYSNRHINMSVELHNYEPKRLSKVLKEVL